MSEQLRTIEKAILDYLKERGGASCYIIARNLVLDTLTVQQTLNTLERKGLARRWFTPLWGATFLDEDGEIDVEVD